MSLSSPSRFERPRRRWIAGVCAGVAARYDRPRWLVRLAFVILCFVGIAGFCYAILWAATPSEGEASSPLEQAWRERSERPVSLAALVLVLVGLGLLSLHGLAVAAILVGVVLLIGDRRRCKRDTAPVS